jgi:hypothetical protein
MGEYSFAAIDSLIILIVAYIAYISFNCNGLFVFYLLYCSFTWIC